MIMDVERWALIEANNLTEEQLDVFYKELEKIPTYKAPINGPSTVLCFQFMEDTGCRVSETIHVKKKDINFRTRILTVTYPKVEAICKCSTWQNRDKYSKVKVLESADPFCSKCHGKGKWKEPQKTTITPRLMDKLHAYCSNLKDDDLLFPVPRKRLWLWGKKAGELANLRIFQEKQRTTIEGIFLHLFRALCSKRMVKDAMHDPFRDQMISKKLRHSFRTVTDRYTSIDINYLWSWEEKTYNSKPLVV